MRFWLGVLVRSVQKFYSDNSTQIASAISYYVLLSIFPLLIFIVSMIGIFLTNSDFQYQLIGEVVRSVPSAGNPENNILIKALQSVTEVSSVPGFFGLLLLAWSGSNMFGIVRFAINRAFEVKSSRNLIQEKLFDFSMIAAAAIFIILSIAASTVPKMLWELSMRYPAFSRSQLYSWMLGEAAITWQLLRTILPFILSIFSFFFIYWIVPASRVPARYLWPGAMIGGLLFEAGKTGFGWFVTHVARYDVVFGSLGAVIAFLVWIYVSSIFLIFGADLSFQYARRKMATVAANS
jgi:membrane protein